MCVCVCVGFDLHDAHERFNKLLHGLFLPLKNVIVLDERVCCSLDEVEKHAEKLENERYLKKIQLQESLERTY